MRIDISNRIGTTSNFGGFRGLLDKFSGAAAGYSLRKLSKSATNAVRVRRSSDNTEQDIGFVGTELDTAQLLAFVGTGATDDGFVTTWYDQSGNSNDATQGTAASQPKIVDAGVLVEDNGKPAIKLNGSSDYMLLTNNFATFQNVSCITVANPVLYASSSVNARFFNLKDGTNDIQALRDSLTDKMAMYNSQFQITNGTVFEPSLTGQSLLFNIYFTNSHQYNKNGNIVASTGVAPVGVAGTQSTLFQRADIFSSTYFNGFSQEMIFYNSDQSSNRSGIEANINKHYNIYP